METMTEVFGEVISTYGRRQAIEDGILVDLMQEETVKMVREAGFIMPVAMTAAAFHDYVWPIEDVMQERWLKERCQDLQGRLWDVLWMLKLASKRGGSELYFRLSVVCANVKPRGRRTVTLKAVCGPGDDGELVITIMLPEED